jgi:transcriptional regulator with XRE-family HTH domain
METSYYISVNIKRFLDERGMKSYKLAEASGCNKTALNNWLYQRQMPSTKQLIKLADYMNISLDYFLGLSDDPRIIRSGTPEKFGRRIEAILRPNNVTSYRLAKECGIGTSAVSKWKDLSRMPSIETMIKLNEALGVKIDYLTGRSNVPF